MSKDTREARRQQLINDMVDQLLDSPKLKRWVREVVLMTLLEAQEQREQGAVKVFLRECDRRGVKVRASKDGQVLVTHADKLGELAAVLTVHRECIWEHLMLHGEHAAVNGHKQTPPRAAAKT